jgi:hypothetical protein
MKIIPVMLLMAASVFGATLTCTVDREKDRIVAAVVAERNFESDAPRSVTFYWSTENADWDKRERTLSMPADHSRTWDWRSFSPRPSTIHITAIFNGMLIEEECVIEKQ